MKKDFNTPLFPIPLNNGEEIFVKCIGTFTPSVAPVLWGENMHDGESEEYEFDYYLPTGELITDAELKLMGMDMEQLEFITMEQISDAL